MNATVDLRLPFAVRPLTPKLGAAIPGVKLADDMTDEVFRAIYQAFLRYQVLLFPPQDVPPARQVGFARQEEGLHQLRAPRPQPGRELGRMRRRPTDVGRPDARDDQDVHATAGSIGPADESCSRSSFTHRTTQQRQ